MIQDFATGEKLVCISSETILSSPVAFKWSWGRNSLELIFSFVKALLSHFFLQSPALITSHGLTEFASFGSTMA
jgi:hypothetical protein